MLRLGKHSKTLVITSVIISIITFTLLAWIKIASESKTPPKGVFVINGRGDMI